MICLIVGTRDERGDLARGRNVSEFADIDVSVPLYHGLCRTTMIADIA